MRFFNIKLKGNWWQFC